MRTESVLSVLTDMEDDLYRVEQIGRLLGHVASSRHSIEPKCLSALSEPLEDIGKQLREQFRRAYAAAGGKA